MPPPQNFFSKSMKNLSVTTGIELATMTSTGAIVSNYTTSPDVVNYYNAYSADKSAFLTEKMRISRRESG